MLAPRRPATGLSALLAAALLAGGLVGLDAAVAPAAASAAPIPPTPAGLTAAIEAPEPYVGQTICDPVAKPGVSAFRDLLLRTYAGTTSLGIVRDCGIGAQSEHKEGRAFDWGVSVTNTTQVADVNALVDWLTRTDSFGNKRAMARRLGIMYMIWNQRIWHAYDDRGWVAYTGADPHTGHVHFSFGWNAAKAATSYWSGRVAAIDYGPSGPAHVTPVASAANLRILHDFGATTLTSSSSGPAVTQLQTGLRLPADGSYGAYTATAVTQFQQDQHVTATGTFGPADWTLLYPKPAVPFGRVDSITATPAGDIVSGWAIDADTTDPVTVTVSVDGVPSAPVVASSSRPDVGTAFPDYGPAHGWTVPVSVAEGLHRVCAVATNAPGTPGSDGSLGCKSLTVQHSPVGAIDLAEQQLGSVALDGWAVDPDTSTAPGLSVTVDGVATPATLTATARTDIGARFPGTGDLHGWTTRLTLPQGSHAVCVAATNVAGTIGTDDSLGCRTVVVAHNPAGAFESLTQGPAGVTVRGWAVDPDSTSALTVGLSVDGVAAVPTKADQARPDVTGYPLTGTAHGFSTLLAALPEGPHAVCVGADNATGTPGIGTRLGCRSLLVRHSPNGRLDVAGTAPGVAGITVRGWAYDPDSTQAATVTLTLDGAPLATLSATANRPDVAAVWPGYGSALGYAMGATLAIGPHTVCADAVNAPGTPGGPAHLGCRPVWISTPVGTVDGISLVGRTATVHGWTIDPDVAAANGVAVYVDGVIARSVAATLPRADLARRLPGYGIGHAFSIGLLLSPGTHSVCSVALNAKGTAGSHLALGCRTVVVR